MVMCMKRPSAWKPDRHSCRFRLDSQGDHASRSSARPPWSPRPWRFRPNGVSLGELRELLAEVLTRHLGGGAVVEVPALGPTRAELRASGIAPEGLGAELKLEIGRTLAMPPGRVRDRLLDRLRNQAGDSYDYWIWRGHPVRVHDGVREVFQDGHWHREGPGQPVDLDMAEPVSEDELRRRFRLES